MIAGQGSPQMKTNDKNAIPWFLFGFLGVMVNNTIVIIPETVTNSLLALSVFLYAPMCILKIIVFCIVNYNSHGTWIL
ncbi:putative sulfate exporter family transporter [Halobacillus shinanisalinarum]|uniref:putative sulfate exporter family transporter n=1 Tax=Halobacillus shinanisalinarum TaxID=2932258 RepID=UPI0037C0B08E